MEAQNQEQVQAVEELTDVHEHQRRLKSQGLQFTNETDESSRQDESVRLTDKRQARELRGG